VNRALDAGGGDAASLARVREVFSLMDGVLDLVPEQETPEALAAWVEERLAARRAARERRDFAAADAIRGELTARGILLEDSAAGTRWRLG
jgi:cysteinyl-tRNA synthetase